MGCEDLSSGKLVSIFSFLLVTNPAFAALIVEEALLRIPEEYRMVFMQREVKGLSSAETSEVLQISEANVKVRLHRAKIMLRKEIEKTYTAQDIFDFHLKYCDLMVDRVMKELNRLGPLS